MLCDTHCHLNIAQFHDDLPSVLDRARGNGIERFLIPGLDLESSQIAVELASQHPGVHAAVGVHPHNAKLWNDEVRTRIENLAQSTEVVAIGEIGLDFYRNLSSRESQIRAFRAQLQLARKLDLPVVIHNRNAISEIMEILVPWSQGATDPRTNALGVLHAYSANVDEARIAIEQGFYLGIAGPITYRNADARREITAQLPLDRLLLETDSPYLTPHPHRGERNEPANLVFIAEKISELLQEPPNIIAQRTTENAAALFRWNNGTENTHIL